MDVAVFPDGPVGFDGNRYLYSKGERLYLDNLAKHFKSVTIFTFALRADAVEYEGVSHSAFNAENLVVHELPFSKKMHPSVFEKLLHFVKLFFIMLRHVKKFDVSYLFLPSYISAIAWLVGGLKGIPHIVYVADDWVAASESMFKWERHKKSLLYRIYARVSAILERKIGSSARFAVTAGGTLRQKFEDFGTYAYETTPRMTLSKEDWFFREDSFVNGSFVCLHVGSLIHDKAQHDLLTAFNEVVGQYPHAKLTIVGEGPERDKLEKMSQELNLSKSVSFKGYVKDEDSLYKIYRESDMFVLSSITEGFPRVLYEAMAASLPIVTTNVGSIPHLMKDTVNALVVKPRMPKDLAVVMIKMASQNDLRKGIIKQGQETMKGVFERMNKSQISNLVVKHF